MWPSQSSLSWLIGFVCLVGLGGCQSTLPAGGEAPAPLPEHTRPHPDIKALAFLEGTWTAINPNRTVNEEVWMAPRGNVLIGAFRQIRLDGDCSFVEVSQIARTEDGVLLRLRHLHGQLEVPDGRERISLFRLTEISDQGVKFEGSGGAKDVESVVYERIGPDELVQAIHFAPETGQESFVTRYRRGR